MMAAAKIPPVEVITDACRDPTTVLPEVTFKPPETFAVLFTVRIPPIVVAPLRTKLVPETLPEKLAAAPVRVPPILAVDAISALFA